MDADCDGVRDTTDECAGADPAADVDGAGCSLAQLCGCIDVTTPSGRKTCKGSDWRNDEPAMEVQAERHCFANSDPMAGRTDDRCVHQGAAER